MEIKISFTGDIFLGDQPHMIGSGVGSLLRKTEIKDYPFCKIQNHLEKSDIVFGNLESSFSKRNIIFPKPFLIDPMNVNLLKRANFSILNIANNHIMENKADGFKLTIKLLKACEIKVLGLSNNKGKYFTKPVIIKKKNKKLLFLGYSLHPQGVENNYYSHIKDEKQMINDIIKVNKEKNPDIILVSVHWGDEYISIPNPKNVRIGRDLVDAGANIVIGHHPHVISPIEKYKNSFIAYSLGNFVFDMNYPLTNYGLLVDLIINKGNIFRLEPNIVEIQKNWIPRIIKFNFNKLIFSSAKIDEIISDIDKYNKILSINRKNYRKSLYKMLMKNFFKNPYYLIPLFSRIFKKKI